MNSLLKKSQKYFSLSVITGLLFTVLIIALSIVFFSVLVSGEYIPSQSSRDACIIIFSLSVLDGIAFLDFKLKYQGCKKIIKKHFTLKAKTFRDHLNFSDEDFKSLSDEIEEQSFESKILFFNNKNIA